MCKCRDVELNLAEMFLQGNLSKGAKLAIACVVHQNIYVDAFSPDLIEKKLRGCRGCQVQRNRLGCDAELALQLVGEFRQAGAISSDQNKCVTILGKELGQFAADADRGASDECSFLLAVHRVK